MGADAVVCGFSMLSLIFVSIFNKGKSNHYFFLYFHDLVSQCCAFFLIEKENYL